jgi:V/A-type H+-transporting ATPase subunit C
VVEYEVLLLLLGVSAAAVVVANSARSATPYAFLMAKTRAREARMLTDAKVESLAESRSLEAVVSGLRGSDYESDLEAVPEEVEALEESLNQNLVRTYRDMLGLLPERARSFLTKFAERLELGNLRLVIQTVSGKVDRDLAVANLGDGLVFSRDRLEILAKSESLEQLVEQLSETEYYGELERYLEPGEYDPSELIRAAEHSYYLSLWRKAQELGRSNRKVARTILGREVDLVNLKLILRLKAAGAGPDVIMKNVIPIEGDLRHDVLRLCAQADSLEGARNVLVRTPLKSILTPVFSSAGDDVAETEKLLDESLLNFSKVISLFKPLTIATPLAYLYQKHGEVRNLRTVSRGVADGIPAPELKSLVTRSARVE